MFIKYTALEEFLKEHKLPMLKETAEAPREESEPELFSFVIPEDDVRYSPFAEPWDKQKDGVVWVSLQAAWDETGRKVTDGEKEVCTVYAPKDFPKEMLEFKPFARTFNVEENWVSELFGAGEALCEARPLDEVVFQGERMFVHRKDQGAVDVLLLHTMFCDQPSSVNYQALLMTYSEKAGGAVTYVHFPIYRGLKFLREHLYDVVTKKTGLIFDMDTQDEDSWLLFPHVTDALGSSERVPSMLTIACDIVAPAYLSFNLPEVQDESPAAMKRAGLVGSPCFHDKVSFVVKKDQALPEEYYVSERFGMVDYDTAEPDKYPEPDFKLPAEYEVKTLSLNEDYTNASHDAYGVIYDFIGISDKITKLVPLAVKQINVNEAGMLARQGNIPKHGNEKKWEPDMITSWGIRPSDLEDIHVVGLFKLKDGLDNEFYILSETGRWYWLEKTEPDNENVLALPGEPRTLLYHGLSESMWRGIPVKTGKGNAEVEDFHTWFGYAMTGYVFGMADNEQPYTYGSRAVRFLKEAAQAKGVHVHTMHGDCYLSMRNDMEVIWDLVDGKIEFETYKI